MSLTLLRKCFIGQIAIQFYTVYYNELTELWYMTWQVIFFYFSCQAASDMLSSWSLQWNSLEMFEKKSTRNLLATYSCIFDVTSTVMSEVTEVTHIKRQGCIYVQACNKIVTRLRHGCLQWTRWWQGHDKTCMVVTRLIYVHACAYIATYMCYIYRVSEILSDTNFETWVAKIYGNNDTFYGDTEVQKQYSSHKTLP